MGGVGGILSLTPRGALKAMELLGKPLGMFERDGEEAQEGVTIVDDV